LGGNLDVNGNEITSASNGNVVINPNGTGNIVLDANVGIGTTSPAKALHVNGDIRLPTDYTISWGDDACRIFRATNDLRIDVGSSERLRIDSSGRLLVGLSTARANFYNGSPIAPGFQIEGTGFTGRMAAIISSNSTGTEAASLILAHQKSGAVGGNTILADGDNVGRVSFQGSDGSEFVEAAHIEAQVDGTPGANDMPGRLIFSTTADGASSPTERMRIDSNGWLYSLPTYNKTAGAAANVGVNAGDGVFFRSTSSIKYKRDVVDYDKGLQEVLQLRPVYYKGKSEFDGDTQFAGLIAEEIDELGLKEFVQYAEDGSPDALAYGHMVSLLTKAIQQQQTMIAELQAEVAALKNA